jgi:hypothetical protein
MKCSSVNLRHEKGFPTSVLNSSELHSLGKTDLIQSLAYPKSLFSNNSKCANASQIMFAPILRGGAVWKCQKYVVKEVMPILVHLFQWQYAHKVDLIA